jgi:mannose-6-phosphate isomerase-like protein (cupin superfamily)
MPDPFTIVNLAAVDDVAPKYGFDSRWEARGAREPLEAERTGVMHFRLKPGKRSPFVHRHAEAEEIYVVLTGSGRMKVGDQVIDVGPLDAIRVAPATPRAFEAGPEGLEYIAVGAHHPGDGEAVEDPWTAEEA